MSTTAPAPPAPAPTPFELWTNKEEIAKVKDPLKLMARVMAAMSVAMANVLKSEMESVKNLTDSMAEINECMKLMNIELGEVKNITDGAHRHRFADGTKTAMEALKQRMINAGVGNGDKFLIEDLGGGLWQIAIQKMNMEAANQNLQLNVDNLSTLSQSAQLNLQTLMGRYNGCFEVVTAAIKKAETQAQSAINNWKK
jgi:hypothetical protein